MSRLNTTGQSETSHASGVVSAERVLLTEGATYALVEVAQQGLNVLLLPVFFFFLSVEDFGVITTALVVSQFTMTISTMGLDFTLLRLYYIWRDADRAPLIAGIWCVSFLWSGIVALVVVIVFETVFAAADYRWPLILGAWAGLTLGLRSIPLSIVRVTGAMRTYAGAELGSAIGRAVCQLVLLWAGFRTVGYLIGYVLGPAVSTVALLWSIRASFAWRHAKWRLSRDVWSYTWRVLPSLAFARFIAVIDRVILFKWSNFDGLGIYGAASRFTTGVRLLTGGFKLAIAPAMSRAEGGQTDSRRLYSNLSRLMLLTMLSAGSGLMLCVWFVQFTPWAARWIEIERLVIVLLLAQFLGGLAVIWQLRFYYSPQPQTVSLATGVSAGALLISLLLLVPTAGVMGAAFAQVIASAASIGVLATIEARVDGNLKSRRELFALTALILPVIGAVWLISGARQLYVLIPTFVTYALILTSTIQRIRRQPDQGPACPLCDSRPEKHRLLIRTHANTVGWTGGPFSRVVICRDCGLAFLSPRATRADYVRFYRDFNGSEDAILAETAAPPRRELARHIAEFCRRDQLESQGEVPRILELGAGVGDVLAAVRDSWGATAVGVELSTAAARRARQLHGLEVWENDIEQLKLDARSFDLILMSAVLEHMMDPISVLRAARTALKPGGLLFLRVPDLTRISLCVRRGELAQRVFKFVHTYYFSPHTIQGLLERVGFTAVRMERRPAPRQGELWLLARPAAPIDQPRHDDWRMLAASVWWRTFTPWIAGECAQTFRRIVGDRRARKLWGRLFHSRVGAR